MLLDEYKYLSINLSLKELELYSKCYHISFANKNTLVVITSAFVVLGRRRFFHYSSNLILFENCISTKQKFTARFVIAQTMSALTNIILRWDLQILYYAILDLGTIIYDLQNEVSNSLGVHLKLQIHPYNPYYGWGMKHPTMSKILRINLYSLINIFLKIPSVKGNAMQTVFVALRNDNFTYRRIVGLLALALVELKMLCKLGVSVCWPSYTVPR